ncbi:MAG: flagellar type III secretion system pore protein FliP [Phycisphaerales bacterium]|nr:MAG: flagellar type III secretion system pore protein FliP [Phycisphaerales bacterium]
MNGEHGGSIRCRTLAVAVAMLVASAATVRAQSPSYPPTLPDEAMAVAGGPAASGTELTIPDVSRIIPPATDPKGVSATLQILVLLTVLTLVPSILVMTTSFPRVLIVLALLRQAVGTQQLPPGQVLLALSLFVTALVMAPTWHKIHAEAAEPYFNNEISQEEAFDIALGHMKDFMYRQIEQADNQEDVYLFLEYAEDRKIPLEEQIQVADVPMTVMVPAFMISELKTAFIMGFRIYLPFLVIDMVIATILISMGMMMLPPVLISLPFKILLFVLADGWHLVVESLLYSFA